MIKMSNNTPIQVKYHKKSNDVYFKKVTKDADCIDD